MKISSHIPFAQPTLKRRRNCCSVVDEAPWPKNRIAGYIAEQVFIPAKDVGLPMSFSRTEHCGEKHLQPLLAPVMRDLPNT
jgi:hypothetical protein